MNATETNPNLQPSAIKSVSCYVACPVETCDRCSAGIKFVNVVTLKDGTTQKFGSECINKILSGDTSLKGLFAKNAKLLARLKADVEILSRPYDQIPYGKREVNERPDSFRIIGVEEGGAWMSSSTAGIIFHPLAAEGMEFDGKPTVWSCGRYHNNTKDYWMKFFGERITESKAFKEKEVARIESFLARIVAKGLATAPNPQA